VHGYPPPIYIGTQVTISPRGTLVLVGASESTRGGIGHGCRHRTDQGRHRDRWTRIPRSSFHVAFEKDIVDAAVREYIDAHRDEINAGIKAALGQLNGSDAAAVYLMTGLNVDELDDLGGLPKQ
jgi:hypothetical protein